MVFDPPVLDKVGARWNAGEPKKSESLPVFA
jgi:hypothetical protein